MDFSDIVYLSVLLFSIGFGKYINKIPDVEKKQNASTLAGIVILTLVSGTQLLYPLVLVAISSLFILRFKRVSHILTFAFSFTFLTVIRYYQCISGHVNLILMMLTLKLVGLSFELHDNRKLLAKINSYDEDWDQVEYLKYNLLPHSEMSLASVVHYSFCYAGVLTGPYYKYQTYLDWCNPRINLKTNLNLVPVLLRLKFLPLYATLFLTLSHFYPVQFVLTDQFHSSHSCLYRWSYSLLVFLSFKLRLYLGFLLSEAVAIVIGLGAYPSFTQSKAGQGPTTGVIDFRKLALGESEWQTCERATVDFSTIQSVNVKAVETEPSLRKTVKLWNSTVQFWMNHFVYRRISNKGLRLYIVFFISALWHGLHSGYFLSLCYIPVYLHIESLFLSQIRPRLSGKSWALCLDLALLLSKTLTLSSLAMCFTLLHLSPIFSYFTSVYFFPFLLHLLMYLGAKAAVRRMERVSSTPRKAHVKLLSVNNNDLDSKNMSNYNIFVKNNCTVDNNNSQASSLFEKKIAHRSVLYSLIKTS